MRIIATDGGERYVVVSLPEDEAASVMDDSRYEGLPLFTTDAEVYDGSPAPEDRMPVPRVA